MNFKWATREEAGNDKICAENLKCLHTKRAKNHWAYILQNKIECMSALVKNLLFRMFMPDGKDLHNLGQLLKSLQEK